MKYVKLTATTWVSDDFMYQVHKVFNKHVLFDAAGRTIHDFSEVRLEDFLREKLLAKDLVRTMEVRSDIKGRLQHVLRCNSGFYATFTLVEDHELIVTHMTYSSTGRHASGVMDRVNFHELLRDFCGLTALEAVLRRRSNLSHRKHPQ